MEKEKRLFLVIGGNAKLSNNFPFFIYSTFIFFSHLCLADTEYFQIEFKGKFTVETCALLSESENINIPFTDTKIEYSEKIYSEIIEIKFQNCEHTKSIDNIIFYGNTLNETAELIETSLQGLAIGLENIDGSEVIFNTPNDLTEFQSNILFYKAYIERIKNGDFHGGEFTSSLTFVIEYK